MEYWQQMEKELARKLKGLLTPGSGNKGIKGDAHTDLFVIEAKWRASYYNDEPYMTLLREWLETISKHARCYGKEPLLAISIANAAEYYLIRFEYWEESDGRLDYISPKTLDLSDRKQLRMYARDDFGYTVFDFGKAGRWMTLPESDLMFLVELARRTQEEPCQKKSPVQRWTPPKRQKTPWQVEKEQAAQERIKQARKDRYQKLKEQKKQDRKQEHF